MFLPLYLITTSEGIGVYRDGEKLLFLEAKSEHIPEIMEGKLPREFVDEIEKRFKGEEILVDDKRIVEWLSQYLLVKLASDDDLREIKRIRRKIKDEMEEWNRIRDVSIRMTRERIRRASADRDKLIIQAIEAVDDLDKSINLLVSRLREWYSLHFPELNDVKDHEEYVQLIKKYGERSKFPEKYLEIAKSSMGADMEPEDLEVMRSLASRIEELYRMREELVKYLEDLVPRVAPNLGILVGPLLAARLMSLAGGLEKLAKLPASTIQVLGAEKALFRHLRKGKNPPKHGVIYQYPKVRGSPRWQRGKIARALAAKLSIAARMDYFSGEVVADELKSDLEDRIAEIREKYKKPPKKGATSRSRRR